MKIDFVNESYPMTNAVRFTSITSVVNVFRIIDQWCTNVPLGISGWQIPGNSRSGIKIKILCACAAPRCGCFQISDLGVQVSQNLQWDKLFCWLKSYLLYVYFLVKCYNFFFEYFLVWWSQSPRGCSTLPLSVHTGSNSPTVIWGKPTGKFPIFNMGCPL